MLHDHVGFCNSPAFSKMVYQVLLDGTGDRILNILDLKPDVQQSREDSQASEFRFLFLPALNVMVSETISYVSCPLLLSDMLSVVLHATAIVYRTMVPTPIILTTQPMLHENQIYGQLYYS